MTQVDVRIVEQDSMFSVVCADCDAVILEKLPSKRAAYCNAGKLLTHVCHVKEQ